MDKHMIHIDDLVRQRLDGAEEPEISGGWLRMKELLDKEMPVQTGVGWGKRRIIGYFAGLLLLTTAGVGGYRYYSSQQPAIYVSGGEEAEFASESNLSPEVISLSMPARDARSAKVNSNSTAASHSTNKVDGNATAGNQSTTNAVEKRSSKNTKVNRRDAGNLTASNIPPSFVTSESKNVNKAVTTKASDNSENGRKQTDAGQFLATNGTTTNTSFSSTNTTNTQPVVNEKMMVASLPLEHLSSGSAHLLPATSSLGVAMPTPRPVKFRFETIETIEIVHHRVYDANTQKTVFRIDTLPKGKMVVARQVPQPEMVPEPKPVKTEVPAKQPKQAQPKAGAATMAMASKAQSPVSGKAETVPQSSAPGLVANKEQAAASEAMSTSKSSGGGFKLWNAEKFEAAVDKFKTNLARMQVYPGVMGGINASIFTGNALGGFQMGLTSLVVLNDWWTLVAELKYMHRFNTGSTVHDDYTSVVPGSSSTSFVTYNGKDYKAYVWKDQSVEHYFNFDVVQTLEMPVALRYSWGRVFALGGLNMVYSMPIGAQEVTHLLGDTVAHRDLRAAQHDDEKFVQDDAPLVKLSDFGPRFGLGYLLGGGFMFTPAVYMDLRVAQTFWDNSKTDGAKQISGDLLRTPSVQLSVGYRFGQKPR